VKHTLPFGFKDKAILNNVVLINNILSHNQYLNGTALEFTPSKQAIAKNSFKSAALDTSRNIL
jgi:hypothetical protein